jgi:hypothetical protein
MTGVENTTGGDDFNKGVEYIKQLFLKKVTNKEIPVYVHTTCALDTNNVKVVFNDVQDFLFRQRLKVTGFVL